MNDKTPGWLLATMAAAVGAGLMYLLDPEQGKRRRAMLRDRMEAARHDVQDFTETQAKRAVDRARGMAAEVRSHVTEDDVALDDDRIGERIRSQLGRLVSHPGAIEVNVVNGYVRLSGHILAAEHDGLLAALRQMPEVKDIDDHLQVHQEAGDIPELQG